MLNVYAGNRNPLQRALDNAAKNMTPEQRRSYNAGRAGTSTYQRAGR